MSCRVLVTGERKRCYCVVTVSLPCRYRVVTVKPAVVTGLRALQLNWTSVIVNLMPPAPYKRLLVEFELTTDGGIHDKRWEVRRLHRMRQSC